ncbi:MAG: hypothetical protein ACOY3I_03740 [Verrucomicrobiota bacterium]
MKSIFFVGLLSLLLFGCASSKKYQSVEDQERKLYLAPNMLWLSDAE